MAIRLMLGSFLTAVALFLWGAFWWTFLAVVAGFYQGLENEESVAAAITAGSPASGTYMIPFPDMDRYANDQAYAEELDRRHRQGPLVQITYREEGIEPMSPAIFAAGFVHFLVCALLSGLLLWLALPGLHSYLARVSFVFLLGLFATVLVNISDVIWFHHPWGYPLFRVGFGVTSWLLAGLILGAFVKKV